MQPPKYPALYRLLSGVRLLFQGKRGYWPVSKQVRSWQDIMPRSNIPYPKMPETIRTKLYTFYQEPNQELSKFLDCDLSHWK